MNETKQLEVLKLIETLFKTINLLDETLTPEDRKWADENWMKYIVASDICGLEDNLHEASRTLRLP